MRVAFLVTRREGEAGPGHGSVVIQGKVVSYEVNTNTTETWVIGPWRVVAV